jgi:type I restriction enzyme R subunit
VKENSKYIMRITGDNDIGRKQLDYFIDVNSKYPVIATTSMLMTTGVDAKTTKLIVLDKNINSMTEFKQIIGRGTRLLPEEDKNYFTIMDFRNISRHFADPDFDGEPIQEEEYSPGEKLEILNKPPLEVDIPEFDSPTLKRNNKFYVDGVEVTILNERVLYYDTDGKLITESIKDYSKKNILNEYATMQEFIHYWTEAEKKDAIAEELLDHGVLLDALRKEVDKDYDDFDMILHVAYDRKPLTKKERVEGVKKKGYLDKYSNICKRVLSDLLDKYMDGGVQDLEDTRILDTAPFDRIGSPKKIAKYFGGKKEFMLAVKELQNEIYSVNN